MSSAKEIEVVEGQCANSIFSYGKDGPSCFKPGQKVFCCQTTTYTDIINACHYAGCGKDCDAGYENPDNVVKYDPGESKTMSTILC